jgi:hypothetical protein
VHINLFELDPSVAYNSEMPQKLLSVNFGKLKADATGANGVGYQILDQAGSVVAARTTTGVQQTAPGIYSALITFSNDFVGQVLWDTGDHFFDSATYAAEDLNGIAKLDDLYNVVTAMDERIQGIYDVQFGRWKIINNQMIFYKDDNVTEVVRFNLFDDAGNPSIDAVFERLKV